MDAVKKRFECDLSDYTCMAVRIKVVEVDNGFQFIKFLAKENIILLGVVAASAGCQL